MLETSERKVMFTIELTKEEIDLIASLIINRGRTNRAAEMMGWDILDKLGAVLQVSPHVGESEEADEG